MFPYTEKYTESESDIQNNDLLYKIDQNCQNTFDFLENVGKLLINSKNQCFCCILYKLHNSYFVFFVFFVFVVIWGFLYFYIYIYYTCRSLTRVGLWIPVSCFQLRRLQHPPPRFVPHPRQPPRLFLPSHTDAFLAFNSNQLFGHQGPAIRCCQRRNPTRVRDLHV